MHAAHPATVRDGPPPTDHTETAHEEASTSPQSTALHEAMLVAIGELSDEDRERLSSVEQADDIVQVWRDLIAERAAREREATVRTELTREFERRSRASRQRPTSGLRGGAPAATPRSVTQWAEFIHASDDESQRQQRRARFADWLAKHPEA